MPISEAWSGPLHKSEEAGGYIYGGTAAVWPIPNRPSRLRGRKAPRKKRLFGHIVQELCESRDGRPELSVLTSLLVSVDVKQY